MNEHYYLYALTRSGFPADPLGSGVDPRFPVEVVPCKKTDSVASRVGLDQFDVRKLESGHTDVNWLSQVAIRHNQIISDAAHSRPLLPLRMGALFHSRASLLDKMEHWETKVIDFLDSIGDRQEWAAKIFLDTHQTEETLAASSTPLLPNEINIGVGTKYLIQKQERHRESRASLQRYKSEVASVETALMGLADRYYRSRLLPSNLTGRREKMLWNAAFLLPRSASDSWLALAEEVRISAAARGLLLEVSGPWPPYHFCPTLET